MKKLSTILLGFTFIILFTGCETFKKPQPEDEVVEVGDAVVGKEAEIVESKIPKEEKIEEKEEPRVKTESKSEVKTAVKEEVKTETPAKEKVEVKTPKSKTLKKETPKSEVKTFSITAKQFEFSPSSITVNEGDTVRISITTKDATHGFVIPDFGINKVVNPGATVTVEFVADKKGTFSFRCSVYCGDGHGGMTGSLTVK